MELNSFRNNLGSYLTVSFIYLILFECSRQNEEERQYKEECLLENARKYAREQIRKRVRKREKYLRQFGRE